MNAGSIFLAQSLAPTQSTQSFETSPVPWLYTLGEIGPWFFAAIALALIVRAVMRSRRYRALAVLGEADQNAVRDAIAQAEKRTTGEIVPIVLERSDAHPSAEWVAAVCALLLGTALLEAQLPWHAPHWLLLSQIGLGLCGFLLARALPDLKRVFIPESRATEMAGEQAFQEFHRLGLHATREHTGVLLFVSLLERRVIVLGDSGIHAQVGDEHWERTREAILDGIRRGSLRDGLIEGIRRCADELEKHFPATAEHRNELPDRLVVRRE